MSFDDMDDSAKGSVWERLNRAKTKSAQLRTAASSSPGREPGLGRESRATFSDTQSVHSVHSSASKISLRGLDGQFSRSAHSIPDCDNIQNSEEKRRFLRDLYDAQKGWAFLAHERPSPPGSAESWRYRQRWPFFDPPSDAQPPAEPWVGADEVRGRFGGVVQHGYISPSPMRNRQSEPRPQSTSPRFLSPREQFHTEPDRVPESYATVPEPEPEPEPSRCSTPAPEPDESSAAEERQRPPKVATFSSSAEEARRLCPKAAGFTVVPPKSLVQ